MTLWWVKEGLARSDGPMMALWCVKEGLVRYGSPVWPCGGLTRVWPRLVAQCGPVVGLYTQQVCQNNKRNLCLGFQFRDFTEITEVVLQDSSSLGV